MCLIAFAIRTAANLPLLLASNRDESLGRPTLPLHRWTTPAGTPVVAGRDEREGGTWLAATGPGAPTARVAMLTNIRHGQDAQRWPRSRGELPLAWLDGAPLHQLSDALDPTAHGGFNLVVGDLNAGEWHWLSNRDAQHRPRMHCEPLAPGVYGLSNAALNTPWPKTRVLRQAVQNALPQWATGQAEQTLWDALAQANIWPDEALPHTGVPLQWERALSAIWVDHPALAAEGAEQDSDQGAGQGAGQSAGYGTRTSALLSVEAHGTRAGCLQWRFQERTWRPLAQQGLRQEAWTTAN